MVRYMCWTAKRWIGRLIDIDRVQKAIESAEERTSGEIRVSVAPWFWGSLDRAADRAFDRLGMTRTAARNGVLFFLVPSRHAFVVRGDIGIHACVGQPFWDDLAADMSSYFRRGAFTEGVLLGIVRTADQLALHFPYQAGSDVNELPNSVDGP
jgi:uncharacterized membrane protein